MAKRSTGSATGGSAKVVKAVKPSRVGRVAVSSWQTPETARQLRILAAEEGSTQQALMAEALNLLFVKYRKPQIAEP
jgi:hypothetical protein